MQVCSNIVHKYTFLDLFLFRLCAWCPLCTQIGYFKHVLLCGCTDIPPNRQKSFCVRTHRAKSAHLPAEYIPLTFLTRTPSPFSAGWRWGLLSRKIFLIFIFLIFTRISQKSGLKLFFWILHSLFLSRNFFYFFKTLLQLVKFSPGIPYQLLSFLVLYSFDYDLEFTSYRWE